MAQQDIFDKIRKNRGPIGQYSKGVHGYFTFPKLEGELGRKMFFAFRRSERDHDYHAKLHDFAEQSEGLFMSVVLIGFGILIGQALMSGIELTWRVYIVSFVFLLVIRPLGGMIALAGMDMQRNEKYVISALGIRGLGTLYYLSYALNQGFFDEADSLKLWIVCIIVILASIVLHGMTASKLLKLTPRPS